MRPRANPWWRRPRKRELPPSGSKVTVVLNREIFNAPPLKAVVVVMNREWYVYEWFGHSFIAPAGALSPSSVVGLLPFRFDLEEEGVTWARGWDTEAVRALLAAEALR